MKRLIAAATLTTAFGLAIKSEAKMANKEYFDSATIQVEVFKDVDAVELPRGLKNRIGQFKQTAVVKKNGEVIDAFKVSTGKEGAEGPQDGSIETPNGYFSFHKVADNFTYFNRDGSTWTPPYGLYFFDPAEIHEPLSENTRRNQAAMHSVANEQRDVTGERESHGCIRSPRNIANLFREIRALRNGEHAALAVYGRSMRLPLRDGGIKILQYPFLQKTEIDAAEVEQVLSFLGK